MTQIRAASAVLPPHYASQDELTSAFRKLWARQHHNLERLDQLHRAVHVGGRYLALPLGEYLPLDSFAKRNDAWLRVALEVGERACREALVRASLDARDVDHIFFVTV